MVTLYRKWSVRIHGPHFAVPVSKCSTWRNTSVYSNNRKFG
jgi:hypothetical protein